jgi:hypothetical protein
MTYATALARRPERALTAVRFGALNGLVVDIPAPTSGQVIGNSPNVVAEHARAQGSRLGRLRRPQKPRTRSLTPRICGSRICVFTNGSATVYPS